MISVFSMTGLTIQDIMFYDKKLSNKIRRFVVRKFERSQPTVFLDYLFVKIYCHYLGHAPGFTDDLRFRSGHRLQYKISNLIFLKTINKQVMYLYCKLF
jgi:hypothetical protein